MRHLAPFLALVLCLTIAARAQRPGSPKPRGGGRAPTAARPSLSKRPSPQASAGRASRRSLVPRLQRTDRQQLRPHRTRPVARPQSSEPQVPVAPGRTTKMPSHRPPSDRLPVRRVSGAERALQQRLASIDKMRDFAVQSGNLTLLDRADALERTAREQHAHMLKQTAQRETPPIRPFDPAVRIADPTRDEQARYVVAERQESANRVYNRNLPEQAQTMGREFGQLTAEQARQLGRPFGQETANPNRLTNANLPFRSPTRPTSEFPVQTLARPLPAVSPAEAAPAP